MTTVPVQLPLLGDGLKRCNRCQLVLPVDDFYRQPGKPNARQSRCKKCVSAESSERWRAKNPLKPKPAWPDDHKQCGRCKNVLPLTDFAPRSDRSGVRSICRDCKRAEKREYDEANQDKRRASDRRYRQENADKIKEAQTRFRLANPEKYQAIRADWKKRNKDAVNASTHKRRARMRHNGGSWTAEDWERLKARYNWRCLMCGKQEMTDGITLCFDHVVPLSLGGLNIISNGQPLCRSCNSLKHRKVKDHRPDFWST